MSPVSTIALEQNLKARTAANASKTTRTVKRVKPSSEVQIAQDGAKSQAKVKATVDAAVAKMTGAPKAKGKGSTKPSPKTGVPLARITESWSGKGGKEVEVGSVVKAPGIASLTIVGRWTKRKGEQKIPFITGTTPDGTRKNVAAADCTVVKGPAAKK